MKGEVVSKVPHVVGKLFESIPWFTDMMCQWSWGNQLFNWRGGDQRHHNENSRHKHACGLAGMMPQRSLDALMWRMWGCIAAELRCKP